MKQKTHQKPNVSVKNFDIAMVVLSSLVFFSLFLVGVAVESPQAIGANYSNVITRVNVTNTEPTLYSVIVDGGDTIDLTPGNTTQVNCTGLVWDYNGWDDVTNVNATLYDVSSGYTHTTADDNNYHYTNSTCANCTTLGTANASCSCYFTVAYYANNATWTCNMSVYDANFTSNNQGNGTINTLLALDVPAEIDFGDLIVTATSATDIVANVTNYGNIDINLTLRGYGGQNETLGENLSMICELGNISSGWERYSVNPDTAFGSMTNITRTDVNVSDFKVFQRRNDTQVEQGYDINSTYWKIYIPLSVGGTCNGTVVFSAVDSTGV